MKSKAKQIERINTFYKKWNYLSESYGWKTWLYFCKGRKKMPKGASKAALAITFADFGYLTARVFWNTKRVATRSDDEIEHAVVHEITHLLLSAYQQNPTPQNLEYVVTAISRCFCGLRQARNDE